MSYVNCRTNTPLSALLANRRKSYLQASTWLATYLLRNLAVSESTAKLYTASAAIPFVIRISRPKLTSCRQDAFMENYLSQQRQHVFSNVGVLIYVFDIESRDFDRDLLTYRSIIAALGQFSPTSSVYILVHKMDLVVPSQREDIYNERVALIRSKSDAFAPIPFATSIWDQSLYKAWAEIIHDLVPNLDQIENHLGELGELIQAEEVLLFERSSFLVVSSWCSRIGAMNPTSDRFERFSNIIKNFKQTTSRYTGTPKSAEQFSLLEMKLPNFSLFIVKFTTNTYLSVCLPPGEERFNLAMENCYIARKKFEDLDSPAKKGADRGATSGSVEA